MERIRKIFVCIRFSSQEIEVGELVEEEGKIYFKYKDSFLQSGLEISPFKLKLSPYIYQADSQPFDGLFGVFADSLPDGWGKLLLDRSLLSIGRNLQDVSLLERLAFVGNNGMGALTFRPEKGLKVLAEDKIELDAISKASTKILEGKSSTVLESILKLNGSSGGARPKIVIGYNPLTDQIIEDNGSLPIGFESWLIKFSATIDRPDAANIEMAYYLMAVNAGIEMSESRLFKGKSGSNYFGTKRFDRKGNNRLHLHSAAGLMHDNFRISNLDYGDIMDCAFKLERNVNAYEKVLRLAAFNLFMHNRDDHSKNFAFLMNEKGVWRFAPAYDLTYSNASHGMHSTLIAGEGAHPTEKHLLELAHYFKVKNGPEIIKQVKQTAAKWEKFAEKAGVSKMSARIINKEITTG